MKKRNRNKEAEAVIDNIMDDVMFYLFEYSEEADKWGEAFKQEFNRRIDTVIAEMKADEEE